MPDEDQRPDISPGWQERVAALREKIRTCDHSTDGRGTADDGAPYCLGCGRRNPDTDP